MWFSVVSTLIDDTRHHSGKKMSWTHEVQPSYITKCALCFSEYVSSIHPWANSRCRISQSERELCFSYVINKDIDTSIVTVAPTSMTIINSEKSSAFVFFKRQNLGMRVLHV